MPKYNVNREFWWKGLKRKVGETVTMTEAQAKYLTHILTKVVAVAAAPVAKAAPPAPAPKAAPAAPKAPAAPAPLSVAVAEVPANGNGAH